MSAIADATLSGRQSPGRLGALWEVLVAATKLGLTSFGGPIAHLGYFHDEYVQRRKWLDERAYADLVALCQFLPGPASSQVGIGVGVIRAGLLGGVVAWLGFTLPSVVALVLFALLLKGFGVSGAGWIHGLKLVAVVSTLLWQTALSQVLLIAAAGAAGLWLYKGMPVPEAPKLRVTIPRSVGVACLSLFLALVVVLPLAGHLTDNKWVRAFDGFYRSGALVFGGGHVVLPLLEQEVVPTGWVSKADFLAGYGAAQAVPGPLFTFAAYLGALLGGWPGALMATVAIFLPAFLLVIGALPFWTTLRSSPGVQGALISINAAVVGILLAALYNPVWTSAVLAPVDFALVAVLFLLLAFWKLPPWVVVLTGALGGALLG